MADFLMIPNSFIDLMIGTKNLGPNQRKVLMTVAMLMYPEDREKLTIPTVQAIASRSTLPEQVVAEACIRLSKRGIMREYEGAYFPNLSAPQHK